MDLPGKRAFAPWQAVTAEELSERLHRKAILTISLEMQPAPLREVHQGLQQPP